MINYILFRFIKGTILLVSNIYNIYYIKTTSTQVIGREFFLGTFPRKF